MTQEIISKMAVKLLELALEDNKRIMNGPGCYHSLGMSAGLKFLWDRLRVEYGADNSKMRQWKWNEFVLYKDFLIGVAYVYEIKVSRGKRILLVTPDGMEYLQDPWKKGLRLDFLRKNMPKMYFRLMNE